MTSISELPLVGGDPALDLINTIERGMPRPGSVNVDYLRTADDLLVWSTRTGLLSDDEARTVAQTWRLDPARAATAVRAAQHLREALYPVLRAMGGEQTDVHAELQVLQRSWVEALGRAELDPSGAEPQDRLRVGHDPAHLLLDRLSVAVVDLVRSLDKDRLRECPVDAGGCGWFFLDQTRNGSRRWCRMADCGTAVKSRRLTERRRAARTGTDR